MPKKWRHKFLTRKYRSEDRTIDFSGVTMFKPGYIFFQWPGGGARAQIAQDYGGRYDFWPDTMQNSDNGRPLSPEERMSLTNALLEWASEHESRIDVVRGTPSTIATSGTPIDRSSTICLASPTVGFYDAFGGKAASMIDFDRRSLAPLFSRDASVSTKTPRCDVLFVYCELDSRGCVIDAGDFYDLVFSTNAAITVVATANSRAAYMAMTRSASRMPINLALTLDRLDEAFPRFFSELFTLMHQGRSLKEAWVTVAAQSPASQEVSGNPSMLFIASGPDVAFSQNEGIAVIDR